MPQFNIPPEDVEYLRKQGYTDEQIAQAQPVQQVSTTPALTSTIGKTLQAHAGSYLGGGAGALGGAALGGEIGALGGPAAPVTIPVGAIIGGVLGGAGGGYLGQKAQQGIMSPDAYAALQQEAAQSAEANPKTALATDIVASAIASGGRPSLNALRAGKSIIGALRGAELSAAEKGIIGETALNTAINPAINAGMSYATTGQLPSGGDLAAQALGGALFGEQAKWAKRFTGGEINPDKKGSSTSEPPAEPSDKSLPYTQPKLLTAPRRFYGDEGGNVVDVEGEVIPEVTSREQMYNPLQIPEHAGPNGTPPQLESPTFTTDILNRILDKRASNPRAVQRIFPNLNLSPDEAAEALRQARLHQEMFEAQPTEPTQEELNYATGIRENTGQSSKTGTSIEGSQENSGNPMVETTPRSEESISPANPIESKKFLGDLSNEDLQDGYAKYQAMAKKSIEESRLQDAANEATLAQFHREELQNRKVTKENPDVVNPVTGIRYKAEQLAAKLESLKSGVTGEGQLHAFGILPATWDTAVSLAQQVIRAGGSVAEAIEKAIGHLKANLTPEYKGKFKENTARQMFSQVLGAKGLSYELPAETETHVYGMEGKVSEAKKEYDRMTHEWYDNAPMVAKQYANGVAEKRNVELALKEDYTPEQIQQHIAQAEKYKQLKNAVKNEPRDTSPRATQYYSTVSALPTNEPMPEWTTSKEGKNVQRVDVVVPPKPGYQSKAEQMSGDNWKTKEQTGVLWRPDNTHENLPNTLGWAMIQYKTGPKGEKIAVLPEIQARWAQEKRTYYERIKAGMSPQEAGEGLQYRPGMNHPLADNPYRLILKAAIEQAKKEGATHIMVSDAETAMMTEGHDAHTMPYAVKNSRGETVSYDDTYQRAMESLVQKEKETGEKHELVKNPEPQQAPGMRLNYDTILPKIAEELTGSKGEKVSLGEHKNAYEKRSPLSGGELDEHGNVKDVPRSNLIFRNPDGTPKTDVSGKLYPLKPKSELLSDALDKLKINTNGQLHAFGLAPALWNTAIDIAKAAIKAGASVSQAIEKAIAHVKANYKGKDFDEKGAREELRKATSNEPLPYDKHMGGFGKLFRSGVDRVRDIGTKGAKRLGDAMQKALDRKDELQGKWSNPVVAAGKNLSKVQRDRINAAIDREISTGSPAMNLLKTQAERNFYLAAKKMLYESGVWRKKIGEPVLQAISKGGKTIYVPRELRMDSTYWPSMPDHNIMKVYRDGRDLEAIEKLDKEFNDWNTKHLGMSEAESAERIATFKKAMQGSADMSDMSHMDRFAANRKSMGSPLPPSFREKDPVVNLERYAKRSAVDASHYEFLEKDHGILGSLGVAKDAWGNPVKSSEPNISGVEDVKKALHQWRSELMSDSDYTEHAIAKLATASMISGPPLEVHKLVSNYVGGLLQSPDIETAVKSVLHSIGSIRQGYIHSLEGGVHKLTARSALNMISGQANATQVMNGLAKGIRDISTLGDLTSKVNAGLIQGLSEVIVPSKLNKANAGNVTAQKFMKHLDPDYTVGKEYSPEEIRLLASRNATYLHGTGDIRSMPTWITKDSELSGFFSLAHWSIAQTNRFMREVYEPATRGDLKPLLTGMFGAAMAGYLIKEIREKITGKKGTIPSLEEIAASDRGLEGNPGLLTYNMMSGMLYAGFGGILSQIGKYPFDWAYKNHSFGATFPLDEIGSDLAKTLGQVATAAATDPHFNWVDAAQVVTTHLLTTNLQLGRIAFNQGVNSGLITGTLAEKKLLGDKLGQLRRFDMAEDLPYNEIDEASNPYLNIEQKKFHLEQDPQKAIAMLPQMIHTIMERYGDQPDVMMNKLQALKQNQYATMPSIEKMPLQYMRYVGYLQRLEGPEEAQKAVSDYLGHKMINSVKGAAVP